MIPSELPPAPLLYPVAQFIVAWLFGMGLAYVALQHYRDYRHAKRMAARRNWQTYQGGSVRASLQQDISPDTEDADFGAPEGGRAS